MPRRRGPVVVKRRPGLVGTAARTAVIAGTATATVNAVSGSNQAQQAAAQQAAAQQAAAAAQQQAAPAEAGGMTPEKIAMLQQLAELKTAGILSDAEFEAEKAKLLAS